MIGESHVLLAKLHYTNGDIENTEKEIGYIDKFSANSDLPLFVILSLDDLKIRLWIKQNNFEAIEQWLKTSTLEYDEEFSFRQESKVLILSRIYNAHKKEDEALSLLEPYLSKAEEQGRFTRFIEILLIKAVALKQKGNTSEALSCLSKAIDIAETKGYFRIFLDEGEKNEELLKQSLRKNLNTRKSYIEGLLYEFKKNQSKQSNTILIDALSKREMDVLLLLAKDFSNQDIANELYISITTVKTHVRNILFKLEAKNRSDAVNKAQEKGIL
jgi:LuxR family maltose regulon positive regulatory protein